MLAFTLGIPAIPDATAAAVTNSAEAASPKSVTTGQKILGVTTILAIVAGALYWKKA